MFPDEFNGIQEDEDVDLRSPFEFERIIKNDCPEERKPFAIDGIEYNNNADSEVEAFGEREKKVGDIVWAKVDEESPFMPAVVVETQLPINVPAKHICVVFFGPRDIGVVHRKNALSYKQHRRQMIQCYNTPELMAADARATAYQSNKELHAKSAQPNEAGNVIKIRKCINPMYNENESNQITQYITDEIDLANPVVQLSYLKNKLALMQRKNRALEEEKVQKDLDFLEQAISLKKLQSKYDRLKNSANTAKRSTSHPIQYWRKNESPPAKRARLSLKNAVTPPGAVKLDEAGNEVYEVQSIVNHKYENGYLEFLVHWKGYTKSDQEWVPLNKLQCTGLLNKYLHRRNAPDTQTLIDRAKERPILTAKQKKKKRRQFV